MQPNPGHLPSEADGTDAGKTLRVHVILRSGYDSRERGSQGWAATGRGACNWRITKSAFDIMEWELI